MAQGIADSQPKARVTRVVDALGISSSCWYYRPVPQDVRKRPGPEAAPIPAEVEQAIKQMAEDNPWYGYKRIAVMCRRDGSAVQDRQAYRVMLREGLLHKPVCRQAELHQALKLYELLPQGPNDLWQMDVTYVHIPGHGWWYAVTVIDYYSRYLLALYLTSSYCAQEVLAALAIAQAEAERLCGPLDKRPILVTDNGSSFMAKRFQEYVGGRFGHQRIRYRTPTQLGLLERMHKTLKDEEVYWRLYDSPGHARECLAEFRARYNQRRPHWALIPLDGGDPLTPEDVYIHCVATRIPKWQGWAEGAKARLDQLMQQVA